LEVVIRMMNMSTFACTTLGILVSCSIHAQGQVLPAVEVIAFERFTASSIDGTPNDDRRLISFNQNPPPFAFSSTSDGFQEYDLSVDTVIPSALLDESFSGSIFDDIGIVDASPDSPGYKDDAWFGVIDTVNCDNTEVAGQCPTVTVNGPRSEGTATWVFNVSHATDLRVSVDMAAMGDFENFREFTDPGGGDVFTVSQDRFDWFYSIDGTAREPLFTSSIDESTTQTYTLAGTSIRNIPDPAFMTNTAGTLIQLDNNFHTITSPILGHGSELTVGLTAKLDGPSEVYAFDNIVIRGALAVEPSELIGDYNDNEIVGLNDLNLVLFNWNRNANLIPVSWLNQRPVDKSVELGELNAVLFNWGNASTRPIGDLSPNTIVPEPGGLILGLQALMVGWLVRRSRRR
jgi:hypothetical protein